MYGIHTTSHNIIKKERKRETKKERKKKEEEDAPAPLLAYTVGLLSKGRKRFSFVFIGPFRAEE